MSKTFRGCLGLLDGHDLLKRLQGGRLSASAEDFHRPGRDLIALDVRRLAGPPDLGDGHVDAARRQVHSERESDRPRAHDQNAGVECLAHCAVRRNWDLRYVKASIGRIVTEAEALREIGIGQSRSCRTTL